MQNIQNRPSPRALMVVDHLARTGRGVTIEEGIAQPNEVALREIATATRMSWQDVLAGMKEARYRGLLVEERISFPGVRTVRLLKAPERSSSGERSADVPT